MKEVCFYLIQVNVALLLFYLLYLMLFARDTFWKVKRFVLLISMLWALIYPWVDMPHSHETVLQEAMMGYARNMQEMVVLPAPVMPMVDMSESSGEKWIMVLLLIAGTGSVWLFIGFIVQGFQLRKLVLSSRRMTWKEYHLWITSRQETPFSFFHWIFVNPANYTEEELDEIMVHENAHVQQRHSWDILFCKLMTIVFWYNPAVWLLQKAVRDNLEFLADAEVIGRGYNRKNYQYHLLCLSSAAFVNNLNFINQFTVSPLKKRIMMMNKKSTSKSSLLKYAFVLPAAMLLMFAAHLSVVAGESEISNAWIQSAKKQIIKGKIVDEKGNPVQGASVVVKGTYIGTVSDEDGCFKVDVQRPGTLCISYVGRITQQIPFELGNSSMKIVMYTENNELDRVVVVAYAQANGGKKPQKEQKKEDENIIFSQVEEMPSFDGNVYQYLAKSIKYPTKAVENNEEGIVYVSFVVDATGEVKHPKVVQGVSESLDAEAVRVVADMPKWKPGKQRNKPVSVFYTLPIEFRLQRQ